MLLCLCACMQLIRVFVINVGWTKRKHWIMIGSFVFTHTHNCTPLPREFDFFYSLLGFVISLIFFLLAVVHVVGGVASMFFLLLSLTWAIIWSAWTWVKHLNLSFYLCIMYAYPLKIDSNPSFSHHKKSWWLPFLNFDCFAFSPRFSHSNAITITNAKTTKPPECTAYKIGQIQNV